MLRELAGELVGTGSSLREIAADAEDVSRFPYVPTVIFGHLRLLAGMVRANRPWRLAARLYGVLAAAFAAGAYGIVASDMWRLSAALSWWRLLAVCLASLAVTIVAVIVAHELWERAPDPRARAQVLLFNVTTALTVTIGIASLYAALFVLVLAGAVLVITAPVLADALGRDTSARDYVTLAWFAASFATVAGALGTVLESDTAVREAAYAGIASPADMEAEDSSLRPRRPARGEWSFVRRGIGIHNRSPHPQPRAAPIPPRFGQTTVAAGAASRTLSTSSGRRRSHRRQPDPSDDRTAFGRCAPALGAAGEQRALGSRPAQACGADRAPDTCWDRLRQRRARREAGLEPGAATMRDESVVESYEQ